MLRAIDDSAHVFKELVIIIEGFEILVFQDLLVRFCIFEIGDECWDEYLHVLFVVDSFCSLELSLVVFLAFVQLLLIQVGKGLFGIWI